MTPAEIAGRLTDAADLTDLEIDGLQQARDGTMMHSHGRKGRDTWDYNYGRLLIRGLVRQRTRTRDYCAYGLTEAGRRALAARDGGGA